MEAGWASSQIFKKEWAWQDLNFYREVAGKEGGDFFFGGEGGVEIFFSVITKNLNWEILSKNLVTFKR